MFFQGPYCLIWGLSPSLGCELPEGRTSIFPKSLLQVPSTKPYLGSALERFLNDCMPGPIARPYKGESARSRQGAQ